MGDIMTTTFIRKIMKGKKIMQKETKKERFDRILRFKTNERGV